MSHAIPQHALYAAKDFTIIHRARTSMQQTVVILQEKERASACLTLVEWVNAGISTTFLALKPMLGCSNASDAMRPMEIRHVNCANPGTSFH